MADINMGDGHYKSEQDSTMEYVDYVMEKHMREFKEHIEDKNNPHEVDKTQVGLSDVDNVKQASKAAFDAHIAGTANRHRGEYVDYSETETMKEAIDSDREAITGKVDAEEGKGLYPTNCPAYTATEQDKLAGIEENANCYVHPTTHPAGMIAQDAAHRMVSDTQIAGWNDKLHADNIKAGANVRVTESGKDIILSAVGGGGGGAAEVNCIRQEALIPAAGWTADEDGAGVHVTLEYSNITAEMVPLLCLHPADLEPARACGLATVAQTTEGGVVLYARRAPYAAIRAELVLLAPGAGGGEVDVPVATDAEASEMLDDVFNG